VQAGKVYFATSNSALFNILDAQTGALIDSINFQRPIFACPSIANGLLYSAGQDWKVVAIDLTTRRAIWIFQTEGSQRDLITYSKSEGSPNDGSAFASGFYEDRSSASKSFVLLGRSCPLP
jgi:eukaryotic-like serine/threonine-protein kinase